MNDCGCAIDPKHNGIAYCSLHREAEAMLKALKELHDPKNCYACGRMKHRCPYADLIERAEGRVPSKSSELTPEDREKP